MVHIVWLFCFATRREPPSVSGHRKIVSPWRGIGFQPVECPAPSDDAHRPEATLYPTSFRDSVSAHVLRVEQILFGVNTRFATSSARPDVANSCVGKQPSRLPRYISKDFHDDDTGYTLQRSETQHHRASARQRGSSLNFCLVSILKIRPNQQLDGTLEYEPIRAG